ncbi:Hypothetical protein DEACI_2919 [Acididesulfobacillus acetoxydans]|uniref:Uncharacterized protein n=1 Tax=Acididesulfobacillus acetoxydans TaxID=1561005 RepID=A0A8S0XCA8_9FIRM|nr:hypothetical protein [Acididesulfobacillus acetoxydans]CAA7602246.1 Hypothetical protein DEACI_2919 [Acididesulfobacillus acetoxydans]CEJ07536.1 Hypothetical protein DEACI_2002 [Acididesulfobacillus acetoxydans]
MIGGLSNILAVATGLAIIMAGSLIFYIFQTKLFAKYNNRVRNAMDKARSEPPVLPGKKV